VAKKAKKPKKAKKDDASLGSVSGLPEELGIDADLGRAQQRLTVTHDSRRYGKPVTVVGGFDLDVTELKPVASELKRRLAVGGSVVDGRIELQGRHDDRLRRALEDLGFVVED
jgi:translation initiation factor 1